MGNDNFSCIKVVTKNVRITLFTAYQTNEISGISDVLETWKRQYIKQLQGIVVSYKNVCLMSKVAYIKSDRPVIDCNVRATFQLFIPTIGSIVKGKVNRISHDYIGCLLHNTINAAIDQSCSDSYDVSHFITLDQEILFAITHLAFKRKTILVKGKITQECLKLMQELTLLNETDAVRHTIYTYTTHDSNEVTTSEENEKSDDTDMKTENQSQSLLCNNDDLFVGNLSDRSSNSPKKKKKKSNKLQIGSTNNLFESLENGNKSPSFLSCNNSNLFGGNSTDVSSYCPRKKKKSNKLQIEQSTNRQLESLENADESLTLLSYNNTESSTDVSSGSPKKEKKKSSKLQIESTNNLFESLENRSESPSLISCNKSNLFGENSTDVSSYCPRKKKKKSNKLQIEQSTNTQLESLENADESLSLLSYNNIENSTDVSSGSSKKKKKKSNKLEIDQSTKKPFESSGCGQNKIDNNIKDKSSDSPKKAKKRKHESPDNDGLPKKKRKENDSISVKTSKKCKVDKTEKKNKEKSKKDSKRDKKKKSKRKVISSKKKLPKLKRKKMEKGEKLKKKKSKKSSKHKKDVP